MILRTLTLLAVIFPFVQAQPPHSGGALDRCTALAKLKQCNRNMSSRGCTEEPAEYLINLYEKGDMSLLPPLLDAGRRSDGALSSVLGDFYGRALSKEPQTFLKALAGRPLKDQRRLAKLTASGDGSGMSPEILSKVRSDLVRVAAQRNRRLSKVASLCLFELNKINGR